MASEIPPKQTSAMRSSFSRKTLVPSVQALRAPAAIIKGERAGLEHLVPSFHHGCGIDPYRLEALALERLEDLLPVRTIARFHRNVDLGALRRHVEEQPAVLYAENVGAKLAQSGRNVPEHAGLIRDGQPEGDDAIPALEFAHHDRGENTRVDVAAA